MSRLIRSLARTSAMGLVRDHEVTTFNPGRAESSAGGSRRAGVSDNQSLADSAGCSAAGSERRHHRVTRFRGLRPFAPRVPPAPPRTPPNGIDRSRILTHSPDPTRMAPA
jgi:hypothetical protein